MFRVLVVSTPGEDAVRWVRRHAHRDWGIEVIICSFEFTDPTSARDRAGRVLAGCPAASSAVRPVEGPVEDCLRRCRPADLVVVSASQRRRLDGALRELGSAVVFVPPTPSGAEGPSSLSSASRSGLHGGREDLRGPPAGSPS